MVMEYCLYGEREPYGYSYEIDSNDNNKRFVFWSEERNGIPGMHFEFNDKGLFVDPAGLDKLLKS